MGNSISKGEGDTGDDGSSVSYPLTYNIKIAANSCVITYLKDATSDDFDKIIASLGALPVTSNFTFIFNQKFTPKVSLTSGRFQFYQISESFYIVSSNLVDFNVNVSFSLKRAQYGEFSDIQVYLSKPTDTVFWDMYITPDTFNSQLSGNAITSSGVFNELTLQSNTIAIGVPKSLAVSNTALDSQYFMTSLALSNIDAVTAHMYTIFNRTNVCAIYRISGLKASNQTYLRGLVDFYAKTTGARVFTTTSEYIILHQDTFVGGVVTFNKKTLSLAATSSGGTKMNVEMVASNGKLSVPDVVDGASISSYVTSTAIDSAVELFVNIPQPVWNQSTNFNIVYFQLPVTHVKVLAMFEKLTNVQSRKFICHARFAMPADYKDKINTSPFIKWYKPNDKSFIIHNFNLMTPDNNYYTWYYSSDSDYTVSLDKTKVSSFENADFIVGDAGNVDMFYTNAITNSVFPITNAGLKPQGSVIYQAIVPVIAPSTLEKNNLYIFYTSSKGGFDQIYNLLTGLKRVGFTTLLCISEVNKSDRNKGEKIKRSDTDQYSFYYTPNVTVVSSMVGKMTVVIATLKDRNFRLGISPDGSLPSILNDLTIYPADNAGLLAGVNIVNNTKLQYIGSGIDFGPVSDRIVCGVTGLSTFWVNSTPIKEIGIKAEYLTELNRTPHISLIRDLSLNISIAYIKFMKSFFLTNPTCMFVVLLEVPSDLQPADVGTFKRFEILNKNIVICAPDMVTIQEDGKDYFIIKINDKYPKYSLTDKINITPDRSMVSQFYNNTISYYDESFVVPLSTGMVSTLDTQSYFNTLAGSLVTLEQTSIISAAAYTFFNTPYPTIIYFKGNYRQIVNFVNNINDGTIQNRPFCLFIKLDSTRFTFSNMCYEVAEIMKEKSITNITYQEIRQLNISVFSNKKLGRVGNVISFDSYTPVNVISGDGAAEGGELTMFESTGIFKNKQASYTDETISTEPIFRRLTLIPKINACVFTGTITYFKNILPVVVLPHMSTTEVNFLATCVQRSEYTDNLLIVCVQSEIQIPTAENVVAEKNIIVIYKRDSEKSDLQLSSKTSSKGGSFVYILFRTKNDSYYYKFGINYNVNVDNIDANFIQSESIDFMAMRGGLGVKYSNHFNAVLNTRVAMGTNFVKLADYDETIAPTLTNFLKSTPQSLIFVKDFASSPFSTLSNDGTEKYLYIVKKSLNSKIQMDTSDELAFAILKKYPHLSGIVFYLSQRVKQPDTEMTFKFGDYVLSTSDMCNIGNHSFYKSPALRTTNLVRFKTENNISFVFNSQNPTSKQISLNDIDLKLGSGIAQVTIHESYKYGGSDYQIKLIATTFKL